MITIRKVLTIGIIYLMVLVTPLLLSSQEGLAVDSCGKLRVPLNNSMDDERHLVVQEVGYESTDEDVGGDGILSEIVKFIANSDAREPAEWGEVIAREFSSEQIAQAVQEYSAIRGEGGNEFKIEEDGQGFATLEFDLIIRNVIDRKVSTSRAEFMVSFRDIIRHAEENKALCEYIAQPFISNSEEEDIPELLLIVKHPGIFNAFHHRLAIERLGQLKAFAALPVLIDVFLSELGDTELEKGKASLSFLAKSSLEALIDINPSSTMEFLGQPMTVYDIDEWLFGPRPYKIKDKLPSVVSKICA